MFVHNPFNIINNHIRIDVAPNNHYTTNINEQYGILNIEIRLEIN